MAVLKLFAGLREAAGVSQVVVEGRTVAAVVETASFRFGRDFADQVSRAKAALNGEELPKHAWEYTILTKEDEVALLPPVSGGGVCEPAPP